MTFQCDDLSSEDEENPYDEVDHYLRTKRDKTYIDPATTGEQKVAHFATCKRWREIIWQFLQQDVALKGSSASQVAW